MASWLEDFGPAEFDRARMPKAGRRPRDAGQAGLFMMAAEPLPAKNAPAEELPGQESMFGPDGRPECWHAGHACSGRAGDCLCPCLPCHERWAGYAAWENARTSRA